MARSVHLEAAQVACKLFLAPRGRRTPWYCMLIANPRCFSSSPSRPPVWVKRGLPSIAESMHLLVLHALGGCEGCGVLLRRGRVYGVFSLHLRRSRHCFRLVPQCGGDQAERGAALQRFNFSTATDATTDATKRAPLKMTPHCSSLRT